MDTKTLLSEAKARFNHNTAKTYLKEKYSSKLIVADQGGLWRADLQTINFLHAVSDNEVVMIDTFDNPVKVNRVALRHKLETAYRSTMEDWFNEWAELEKKR